MDPVGTPLDRMAGLPPVDLVERARARDPEALAALFEGHFDRLYSLAFRLTGARATAEDLVQDTFLRLHRAVGRLDPRRDPGPWLTATLVNLCRDLWRSGAHRIARGSTPIADPQTPGEVPRAPARDDPEQSLLFRERERLVEAALLQLPEDLRLMVVLRDWLDLGHDEIAAMTGISHAAARKRYSRALERLAGLLKETLAP